jgi:hypothetical protein
LNEINGITHQFDTKQSIILSLIEARAAFINCKQGPTQSNAEYLAVFTANVQVLEHYKAVVGEGESYMTSSNPLLKLTAKEREQMTRDRTIGMAFLRNSDQRRFASLWSDLANQKARGLDQYPADLTSAYSMLVNYHSPPTNHRGTNNQNTNQNTTNAPSEQHAIPTAIGPHTFTQTAAKTAATTTRVIAGTDGVTHDGVNCFSCHSNGHYSPQCAVGAGAVSLLQHAIVLTQNAEDDIRYNSIPPHWILLDSQSNISIFHSPQMITNIRSSPKTVTVRTNGGHQTSSLVGDFANLGMVWYNPDSIANILALSDVRRVCRVTMDSASEPAILIHRTNGTVMKFKEHINGLYFFDTLEAIATESNDTATTDANHSTGVFTLVNTVDSNKSLFVSREIEAADKARELYRKLGRPSQATFESIIAKNLITNCPITVDDIKRVALIYGPCRHQGQDYTW